MYKWGRWDSCEWYRNPLLNCVHMHSTQKWNTHRQRCGGLWWLVLWESLPSCPSFYLWKDTMVRNENSSWKTHAWKRTCTRDATAPLPPGLRVNELPHKFHSSQALMSCCSLSIILTGEHLSSPHSHTMTLRQASAGSHGRQNERVLIVCTKLLFSAHLLFSIMLSVRVILIKGRWNMLRWCWDAGNEAKMFLQDQ